MEDQHQQAVRTLAAERYMLGEMTDEERERFEEHYFDCRVCVEDVKAIDLMARAVIQQRKQQPVRKWPLMNIAPWTIAAGLAAMLFLPPRVAPVPAMAEVPFVTDHPLTTQSRAVVVITKLRAGRRILQYLEITPDPQYTQYRWDLRVNETKSLGSGTVTPEQTNEQIPLLLGPLPAGSYQLVIEGVRKDGNRSTIITHSLVVGGS